MKAKNTEVKIEAHGHLGDFSEVYFIPVGKEWSETAWILRQFLLYVRTGWNKQMDQLFQAIAELERKQAREAEKVEP